MYVNQNKEKFMYYRTHNCNELRAADEGKRVKIAGWIASATRAACFSP